ncbi:DUF4160 domain-containing protein [Vibrio sp. JC009]|uniref:type II toxin-antitoxin system toxin DhiT n=1 Tax=Vibrio sp. JC009 TaxID=2912314 RepID=UPI0023B1BF87|nr:DUF4160 domain-containing protein [Vibrio sp. JC009]WED22063.1 DUF4160 domain-containing protein [Vibrio sp. JC009]
MPEILKRLLGLKFQMRYEDNDFHNRPHIHVSFGEYEASIAIDDIEVLAGFLPPKKRKLAEFYIDKHRDELLLAWDGAVIGQGIGRIN